MTTTSGYSLATLRRAQHSWTWALNFSFEALSCVGLKSNCFDGTGGHGRRPRGESNGFYFHPVHLHLKIKKRKQACLFFSSSTPPLLFYTHLPPSLLSHRHSSYLLSRRLFLYLPFTANMRRDKGSSWPPVPVGASHRHNPSTRLSQSRVNHRGLTWMIQ